MGKGSKPTIGYQHFMGLYMGECRTTDYLAAVEIGGEMAWEGEFHGSGNVGIYRPMLFGGDKKEGGVVGTLRVRQGEADQMPDAYMQARVPGPWPAARGLCTTVFDGQVGAMNPYLKLWAKRWGGFTAGWTTPVWEPSLCKIGRGKNPMHIVYQALTDVQSGLGLSTTSIDEESFLVSAQRLVDEEFGLTLPFRRSDTVGSFIQIVCDHIGGQWAVDQRTNLITFRLFRDDYVVDELELLDESNIIEMESFEQPSMDGSTNEVTVIGVDYRTGKPLSGTYQNLANVQAQGRVVNDKRNLPGLWNRDLVNRVAARETHQASSLLARIKCKVKADLWGIKRGDVRALSWKRKGWVRVPVRVLEVDNGLRTDSSISLTLSQDISGMVMSTYITPSDSQWTPPDDEPKPLPAQQIYEATYRDLAGYLPAPSLQQLGADSGFVVSLGARPAGPAYGYDLVTRTGSAEFVEVSGCDFSPSGLLSANISATQTLVTLTGGDDLDVVVIGSEWRCGDEHGRVDAIDPIAGTVTIARGCVDTVPTPHLEGDRMWFTDTYAGSDPTEYLSGETVNAKLLCRTKKGTLDPDLAPGLTIMMAHRQGRPYPPGRVRVEGVSVPSLVDGEINIAWAHRDRVLQANQLVETEAASVGPALDTRYALRFLDDDGVLLVEKLDIAGAIASAVLAYTGTVTMELFAVNDAGNSWQRHVRDFDYTPPVGTIESSITADTWEPTEVIFVAGGA